MTTDPPAGRRRRRGLLARLELSARHWISLIMNALLAVVLVALLAAPAGSEGTPAFFGAVGVLVATFAGAAAVGTFLGFLFGIPKQRNDVEDDVDRFLVEEIRRDLLRPEEERRLWREDGPLAAYAAGLPEPGDGERSRSMFVANNNLADVSDWLTKILLGAGLVQLSSLPGQLDRLSSWISSSDPNLTNVAALAVLLVGLVQSFTIAFLWVAIEGKKDLEDAHRSAVERLRRLEGVADDEG